MRAERSTQQRFQTCALSLLVALAVPGCGDVRPRTQVTVVVNADAEVRAVVESLRLEVFGGPRGGDEYPAELSDELPVAGPITWPVTHAVIPRNGDSNRLLRVEATARGLLSSGSMGDVAHARVITGFVAERTLQVELTFYASCLEQAPCDQRDFSCGAGGVCLSARREPGMLPGFDGGPGPNDAGRDGGNGLDAGQDAGGGCTSNADCDDSDVCTDDICSVTGCVYTNNNADCLDATYCNGAEQCRDGICTSPGDPCGPGTACDESADVCAGCLSSGECPPPEEIRDPCDYGTDVCTEVGTRLVFITPYECRAGVCQPGTTMQTSETCTRNTEGAVCAMESCEACGLFVPGLERCTPFSCKASSCTASMPFDRPCGPPISDGGISFDAGDAGEGGVPPPR